MEEQNKRIIAVSIIVLIVGLGIIWFFYHRSRTSSTKILGQPSSALPAAVGKPTASSSAEINHAFIQAIQKIYQTDKDFDGISDADEINIYHTDPNKADTDGDGLLDGDEVKIYKTDPLKFDTYGIGHSDGWGVRHGVILPDGKVDCDIMTKLNIKATNKIICTSKNTAAPVKNVVSNPPSNK